MSTAGVQNRLGGFSLYVGASDPARIREAGDIAQAVTVSGLSGPGVVSRMRSGGWHRPVLFDGAGYATRGKRIAPEEWAAAQRAAMADQVLSPGRWADWNDDLKQVVETESVVARRVNAMPLVALDSRWLTRRVADTIGILSGVASPVALVLSNKGDPLAAHGAVDGLIALVKRVEGVSLLRADHGAIGATAYGAAHASIGLQPSHRHLVPPGTRGGGKVGDHSARLFVRQLMDWFTAQRIADWGSAGNSLDCKLWCCGGEPLSRFLDSRLADAARRHNQVALTDLARHIQNAPPNLQRRIFADECRDAVRRYDTLGAVDVAPKSQLDSWVLLSSWW